MRLRVLGTAAGGGVPQWNCACPGCAGARAHPSWRRRHASLAVRTPDGRCHVVNATPDIGDQIEASEWLVPGPGLRDTPLAGIILTDAELDHTLGIARLREADQVEIVATPAVRHALTERLRLEEVLSPYTDLVWKDLGQPVALGESLRVSAVPVSGKRPRYAPEGGPEDGWVSALRLSDGATVVYAPAVGTFPPALEKALAEADCVIIDGTFWDDEEPRRTGISSKTATQMGHVPIEVTAPMLAGLPGRCFYTHLNNTNPLLDPDAPQHRLLAGYGVEVAADGMVIEL
ncbi:pyrroloquinoline quinone biosynthesis protein PqqB [Planotetraspora sp. GP83]|uniref:pyrroloquinoline quinone biosynthesis protein PqqB n=1 Tax=Planotetraspora sp. GP83 TaxID=3156264 RepID=UPI00387ED539